VPGSTQSTSLEQVLCQNPHQLPAIAVYQKHGNFAYTFPVSGPCLKALDNAATAAVSEDKSPSDLILRTLQEKMPGPKFMTLFL
jgi:hypothetical protein